MRLATYLGLSVFLTASAAAADPIGNERYLRLEQAPQAYEEIKSFGNLNSPLIEVADTKALPTVIDRGAKILSETFDGPAAEEEWLRALASTDGDVPEELETIAERMGAIQRDLFSRSIEELQSMEADAVAAYEARPDRATIDAISSSMATSKLAAEVVVTGRRVKWAYEAVLTMDWDGFRSLDAGMRRQGVLEVLETTRIPEEEGYTTPLNVELASERWRMVTTMVLSELPAADIAVLGAFYDSEAGRRKRDSLVRAFRDRNDADGEAFLVRLLDEFARQPAE